LREWSVQLSSACQKGKRTVDGTRTAGKDCAGGISMAAWSGSPFGTHASKNRVYHGNAHDGQSAGGHTVTGWAVESARHSLVNHGGVTMKQILIACIALSLSAAAFAAPAQTAAPAAKTAQQNKMVTCNADATGKKGDERQAFMKTCLSAAPAKAAPTAQQQKMKTCNAEATGKKGDARKAFMKTCLSGAA
jgi:hypothetical protein